MKKILLSLLLFSHLNLMARSLSLSFDDVPNKSSTMMTDMRTDLILKTLHKHGVKAVFYVNTNKIDPAGLTRIKKYIKAGHVIGNHTHSHISANDVLSEIFLVDTMAAKSILSINGIQPTYFRYPYLKRGSNVESKEQIRRVLLEKGYQDGFVTIPTADYIMDDLYQKATKSGKAIDKTRLKDFYVDLIHTEIRHYDALAFNLYAQRSPNHVLLLHENDITALHLDALLTELSRSRWTFCRPEESYQDQDLNRYPSRNVMSHQYGRVVAHAVEQDLEQGARKEDITKFISQGEKKEYLETKWTDYRIVEADEPENPLDLIQHLLDRVEKLQRQYKISHPLSYPEIWR